MKPLVCDYLSSHSLVELTIQHGINVSWNKAKDKFSLNYDQFLSQPGIKLVEQCRGLILRPVNDVSYYDVNKLNSIILGETTVLSRPLDRFYNVNDPNSKIDLSSSDLTYYEKLDGTMVALYWDEKYSRWYVSTRAVPEADVVISDNLTFNDLFFKCFKANLNLFDTELTYVFELMTRHNRVVCEYQNECVTLLAVRTKFGKELDINLFKHLNVNLVEQLNIQGDIIDFVKSRDPFKYEGIVVCDGSFRRLKVKNPEWCIRSRAKDLILTNRKIIKLILSDSVDDVYYLLVKEDQEKLDSILRDLRLLCHNYEKTFFELNSKGISRKEFSQRVLALKHKLPFIYFRLFEVPHENMISILRHMYKTNRFFTNKIDDLLSEMSRQFDSNVTNK